MHDKMNLGRMVFTVSWHFSGILFFLFFFWPQVEVPPPPLPTDFTVLHNDPAALQDHCAGDAGFEPKTSAPEGWCAIPRDSIN